MNSDAPFRFGNSRLMKIFCLTINNFTFIPVTRYIIRFFASNFRTEVMEIHTANQYKIEGVKRYTSIAKNKSYKAVNSQSAFLKIWKYVAISVKYLTIIRTQSIVYTPDFQVLAIGIWLKKNLHLTKWRIVYHQFEVIEDQQFTGINENMWKYVKSNVELINFCIFPEEHRKKYFNILTKNKSNNSLVFANTCEIEKKVNSKHPAFKNIPPSATIFGHVGNMGTEHYFQQFINIIENTAVNHNVFFFVVGRFSENITKELRNVENPNFVLLEEVPHAELKTIYPFLDYGFILYKGVDINFEYCAPNKLYEYWSYGIPVIAHPLSGLKKLFDHPAKGKLIDFEQGGLLQELNSFFLKKPNKTELKNLFENSLSIKNELKKLENILA